VNLVQNSKNLTLILAVVSCLLYNLWRQTENFGLSRPSFSKASELALLHKLRTSSAEADGLGRLTFSASPDRTTRNALILEAWYWAELSGNKAALLYSLALNRNLMFRNLSLKGDQFVCDLIGCPSDDQQSLDRRSYSRMLILNFPRYPQSKSRNLGSWYCEWIKSTNGVQLLASCVERGHSEELCLNLAKRNELKAKLLTTGKCEP